MNMSWRVINLSWLVMTFQEYSWHDMAYHDPVDPVTGISVLRVFGIDDKFVNHFIYTQLIEACMVYLVHLRKISKKFHVMVTAK